jgi:hypothetical protein
MSFTSKLKRIISTPKIKETILPSYHEKIEIINEYRTKFDIKNFIETGTFLGDTTDILKKYFDHLYTIELSEDLATRAKNRFKDDQNIEVIQGNSGEVLASLVPQLTKPSLFWLDSHYSSEFFYKGEYFVTAKAEINTPIEKEIEAILNSDFSNVILIDDARLFVGELDYPTIDTLKKSIGRSDLSYNFFVAKDIIHIIPKK